MSETTTEGNSMVQGNVVALGLQSDVAGTRKLATKVQELAIKLGETLDAEAATAGERAAAAQEKATQDERCRRELEELNAQRAQLMATLGKGPKSSSGDAAKVREWAAANGHEVGARGRIPQPVVDAYQAAQASTSPVA